MPVWRQTHHAPSMQQHGTPAARSDAPAARAGGPAARNGGGSSGSPAAAAAPAAGSSSSSSSSKPDWVRILEEDARFDEEVAELLAGTDGDPDRIRAKMEAKLASPFGSGTPGSSGSGSSGGFSGAGGGPAGLPFETRTGSDAPPHIMFREVDVFDLWVWVEFLVPPAAREQELLQSTVKSWFVVGKLGGFNSQNLQVYYNNTDDNSFMEYDSGEATSTLSSYMHSCSDVEFKGSWARFHVDLGTADELAFDALLNMLVGFSHEVAGISRIQVGGEHERWQVPAAAPGDDDDDDVEGGLFGGRAGGRPARQHGQAPKVGINPMKLPTGIEEDLEMLDELGMYGAGQPAAEQQQQQPQQQQQQQREWGKGLRPLGAGVAGRGRILRRQPAGQAAAQPSAAGGAAAPAAGRGAAGQQPPLQQSDMPPGVTLYSEDDFRRIFGVEEGEEL